MRQRHQGFTLIEVMITVAIVAILAAIAIPSYWEYVARSNRNDARLALAHAAQWMERYRGENNGSYIGSTLPPSAAVSPLGGGRPQYDIAIAAVTATSYSLTATPRTSGSMRSDACGALTLQSDGLRLAAGAMGQSDTERCWSR